MNTPDNLLYTNEHEWIRVDGNEAYIGITDYAQSELGDIVFLEIDTEGESLQKEEVFGTIEAVKTVSDLFMPISGKVLEINEDLADNPDLINTNPYDQGWVIKISILNREELNSLLSNEEYKILIS